MGDWRERTPDFSSLGPQARVDLSFLLQNLFGAVAQLLAGPETAAEQAADRQDADQAELAAQPRAGQEAASGAGGQTPGPGAVLQP
jgi:hypothetical protein